MTNLAYFSHSNTSTSETFIFDLVSGLSNQNELEVTFISGQTKPRIRFENIETINTGFADKNPKLIIRAYKIGQLKDKGFQLQFALQKRIAKKALIKAKLPSYDIAFIEYATTASLIYDYLKERDIPYIIHVHGYDITSSLNNPVYKRNIFKILNGANYIIAASEYVRKLLLLLGCTKTKIKLIRLGVDTTSIIPLSWQVRKKNVPSVIYLGRLTPKKHPIALIHAFELVKQAIPEAKLTIIGEGELKKEIYSRVKKLNLEDSVAMLGSLTREKAFSILNRHWIYAQHSVTALSGDQEGFGISLAEAAAHELPVVSTYHNGIPENVIDGKTGLLVKEFDFEGMAEKIIYLLQNPNTAEKMGKAGREHIKELCQPEKRIEEIKQLILKSASIKQRDSI